MPQIVRITITRAEEGIGPFNLFSDVDNFYNPFEGNLSLETLKAGYISTLVPDKTTVIQVKAPQAYLNLSIIAPSPSVTPSITPTVTTTPSVTPSLSPAAASISPTPSVSPAVPSVTPSITRTPSVTPTLTPTPSVTPSAVAVCQIKEYTLASTGSGAVFTYYADCTTTGSTTATLTNTTSSIVCAREIPIKTSGTGSITATGDYCNPTLVAIQLTSLGTNCSYDNDVITSNIAYVPYEPNWFIIQNGKAKIKDDLTPPFLELPLFTSVEGGVTISPYSVSSTATTFTVTDNTNQGTYGVIISSAANGTGMTLYIGYDAVTGRKYITNRTICYY